MCTSFYLCHQNENYTIVNNGKDVLGLEESIHTEAIDECLSEMEKCSGKSMRIWNGKIWT